MYTVNCIPDTGASGEDNFGYKTLLHCSDKIIAGLSSEPKTVSDTLHGKD